ncbi:uncharacterized protein EV420DRAFT_1600985 [Desarmillaria tabescens]|uniref:Uncharacterized protein n=1 Tax=Armillaria tabescens TaxID=1929756 RepID=A0AA39J0L4_ARMTA|nr:uncharacterized protein EV420DRAFT_1600985 [Desarmillaria tabescens]KAK0433304.1 hypothetical protein EV420DRAFT_1600985 [Desarmillaria tabescens]
MHQKWIHSLSRLRLPPQPFALPSLALSTLLKWAHALHIFASLRNDMHFHSIGFPTRADIVSGWVARRVEITGASIFQDNLHSA